MREEDVECMHSSGQVEELKIVPQDTYMTTWRRDNTHVTKFMSAVIVEVKDKHQIIIMDEQKDLNITAEGNNAVLDYVNAHMKLKGKKGDWNKYPVMAMMGQKGEDTADS